MLTLPPNLRTGLGTLAVALLVPVAAGAQSAELVSTTGDGSARFTTNELGANHGCDPGFADPTIPGFRFDPLGPFTERNVNCYTALMVFDQARTTRQVFDFGEGGRYRNICAASSGGIDFAPTDVFVDYSPSPNVRITHFMVPNFPGLRVILTQTMCSDRLTQTYQFHNDNPTGNLALRLARVSDLDLDFTANYTMNTGAPAVEGASVVDNSGLARMTITAPTQPQQFLGNAVFEGYRIHQSNWGGAAAFPMTWNQLGYQPGDLNGTFFHQGGDICTLGGAAPTAGVVRDTAVVVQSVMNIPAGQFRRYVTETIPSPGPAVAQCCGNTQADAPAHVVTSPTNAVSVEFTDINSCGHTTMTQVPGACLQGQSGYTFQPGATCWEISTTATYTGPIEVCIDYPAGAAAEVNEAMMGLYHYLPNGTIEQINVTPRAGVAPETFDGDGDGIAEPNDGGRICGTTTSLSPFLVALDACNLFSTSAYAPPMGRAGGRAGSTLPLDVALTFSGRPIRDAVELDAALAQLGQSSACPELRLVDAATGAIVATTARNDGSGSGSRCFQPGQSGWRYLLALVDGVTAGRTYEAEIALGSCILRPSNGTLQVR